ncbi:hypothetical protein ALC60_01909 [Trachymyrmex zeteki]|uniref:Uncharacterized protein n=1 Tax=Mycetomoellerius zeteki TaxID=64791 RepID=A0A151XFA7_9HYME|nr:hypothetical protein ALC60_01909 [Trachymyrmex zeteki]
MRTPYVRYSRVPIAMWLMRVHVLPSVCESPSKIRPTCQYESIYDLSLSLSAISIYLSIYLSYLCTLFLTLLFSVLLYRDTLHSGQKNKKFFKIKENVQTNHRAEAAETATVFKVLRRARLIGTGTTSVKASGALKRIRGQIRFKGPGYIRRRPDRGACIIWGFLGTANE